MKFFHKYTEHSLYDIPHIIPRKPEVALCSIEGDKRNCMHYNYLPYDAEIEYLESSTDQQYIDTGINYDFSKNIKIEVGVIPLNNDRSVVIGNYTGSSACLNVELGGTANSHAREPRYYISLTATGNTSDTWYTALTVNNNYNLIIEYNISSHTKTFTSQNSTSSVNYQGTVYGTTTNLRLFYDYRSSNNVAHALRITYCKIYLDDIIVKDFIPVRVGSTGYMYDRVSKQLFGNGGGGVFTLGQDIIPIEYLQSTGTQYISLPFGFDKTDEVYFNFSVDSGQNSDKYMVSPTTWNNNNNRFAMGVHQSKFTAGYGNTGTGNTYLTPSTNNDGQIHKWVYKNYIYTISDLNLTKNCSSITFGGTSANLKLFYGYNANTKGKITYYKHIKSNMTIELIPVRIGTVGYMYDKVSRQLFGNSGTGSFTLGPDIT